MVKWLTIALFMPIGAAAQESVCVTHEELTTYLGNEWNETPRASGLDGAGRIISMFASPDGRTWSLVAFDASGIACILNAGSAFIAIGPEPQGEDM